MKNTELLEALKRLRKDISLPMFRTSITWRRDCLNQVVPLLLFNPHYYTNAVQVADILSRPGFSSSLYDQSMARLESMVGQAIVELELKLTSDSNPPKPSAKRDRELQKLLLLEVRDGQKPPELSHYTETDQVYNAVLLIDAGLVKGETIRNQDGECVSAILTRLTSAGHDFLEAATLTAQGAVDSADPAELVESLRSFRKDNPDSSKCAFIMMRFGRTKMHNDIVASIRGALKSHGIAALRADDKDYNEDLFSNIRTYMHGCDFGVAVFERIEQEDFNPNVSLEVGYMLALRKPVLLLKDRTLKNLNTDLIGKLYKVFDLQSVSETIAPQLERWLKDRSLIA